MLPNHACTRNDRGSLTRSKIDPFSLFCNILRLKTSLIERELSRTQFQSMVVIIMVWHVVEDVCKDELSKFWCGGNYDTMFWCMVLCETLSTPSGVEKGVRQSFFIFFLFFFCIEIKRRYAY